MGAWGTGVFENDTACDWIYTLVEGDGLTVIQETLERVFEDPEDLDADTASEALAAIETLLRLGGKGGEESAYTERLDQWVKMHSQSPPPKLLGQAQQALEKIASDQSELMELWADSDVAQEWQSELQRLRHQLKP